MLSYYQQQDYYYYLKRAEQALNKMQVKIATIKGIDAISIAKRKENEMAYNALKKFIESSENIVNRLIEENEKLKQEQFSKGYAKGVKDEKESSLGGIPNKYFDKEGRRAYCFQEYVFTLLTLNRNFIIHFLKCIKMLP